MTGAPTPHVETAWTEATITERCRVLRGTLLSRGEPAAALDAFAPAGAENYATDPLGAAVVWFSRLQARLQFLEWRDALQTQRRETALAAALANVPVPVLMSDGVQRSVYPKSYHALRWCDALDHALADVSRLTLELAEMEVTAIAPLAESLAVRIWVWILTSPEPDVPFREGEPLEPPAWTQTITPEDLLAILHAHFTVNRERIALVAELFPPEREAESRLSLVGFLGTVAQELHQRPSDLLRRWTMGEAFAQAVVTALSAAEVRERAERDAAERRR